LGVRKTYAAYEGIEYVPRGYLRIAEVISTTCLGDKKESKGL
jgi:hypothetical protein